MLYIRKSTPPVEIIRAIAAQKSTPEWRGLSNGDTKGCRSVFNALPKNTIRDALLKDQHYLCAYCMRKIQNNQFTSIEHFKPLSLGKEYALDYSNFLVVCDGGKNSEDDVQPRLLCCDASKSDQELNILNPMDSECMSHIVYTRDGKIEYRYPENWTNEQKEKVNEDINCILVLNGKLDKNGLVIQDTPTRLVTNRKYAYESYKKIVQHESDKKRLTPARIEKIIQSLLSKDEYDEYVGVIIYFLARKARNLRSKE